MNREITGGGGASIYPLTGDVLSSPGSPVVLVTGLQGVPIQQGFVGDGDFLVYNESINMWVPTFPLATTSDPGIVQPDGTTITIAAGIISAVSGGGGITRGALNTNANGSWWVWSDGTIEEYGNITVAANGTSLNSGSITFPLVFPTSVDWIDVTVVGVPKAASNDVAEVQVSLLSPTFADVNLQCSVPVGGGGATFNNPVQVYWRAIGH